MGFLMGFLSTEWKRAHTYPYVNYVICKSTSHPSCFYFNAALDRNRKQQTEYWSAMACSLNRQEHRGQIWWSSTPNLHTLSKKCQCFSISALYFFCAWGLRLLEGDVWNNGEYKNFFFLLAPPPPSGYQAWLSSSFPTEGLRIQANCPYETPPLSCVGLTFLRPN